MHGFRLLVVLCLSGSFAFACAKGRDAKSAGKDGELAYDEQGHGKKCDSPKSTCEEVHDPSLDFKEKCRESGFRIKQCGCDNLCSGNISGDRVGYTTKNKELKCAAPSDKCEQQETSAAFQDACDAVGGELMDCGCESLCSKKLTEALPDAPKDEKKNDDSATDSSGEKKKEAAPGNMDGKSADELAREKAAKEQAAKDKAAKDKAAKDKASKDKSSKEKSSKDSSSSKPSGEKKSRFFNDE
jgi:hypothetical protein